MRTSLAAIVAVAALMVFAPSLSGLHPNATASASISLASYNPTPVARFHAPLSDAGLEGLTHAPIPSVVGVAAGPAATTGGMSSVPSNALRFINDGSYMPQSETTIAVDPYNTSLVVGGVNDARMFFCPSLPRSSCPSGYTSSLSEFSVSNDGGATLMKSNDLPGVDVTDYDPGTGTNVSDFLVSWGDPSIAAGTGTTFYYASLAISTTTSANGVMLAVSNNNLWNPHNGCVTPLATPDTNPCWTSKLVFGNLTTTAGSFEDKELIAVDHDLSSPYFGDIYVSWDHFYPTGYSSTYAARCTPSLSCTMISGGSAPVLSGSDPFVAFSTPTVSGSGSVYVSWCNYGTPVSLGPIKCIERGSGNGGSTWGARHMILSFDGPNTMLPWAGGTVGFATEQFRTDNIPVIAADTSGMTSDLYFVISVCTSGNYLGFSYPFEPGLCGQSQVVTSTSTNGGATWSTPMNVSTPAVNTQPWVSVDPSNGHVVITYLTSAYDPFNHRIDVVSAVSSNNGSSYTNHRLTNVSNEPDSDPNYYDYFQTFGGSWSVPQYGDYIQAAEMNGHIWALFTGDYASEQGTLQADPFLVMGSD